MPARSTSPSLSATHLEHVDAMRPFAQSAVIATHALIFFSPLATSAVASNLLTLTRFSREAFFFITALVLTLTYLTSQPFDFGRFWRRRLLMTGVPYLSWTIIYYAFTNASPTSSFPYYHVPWGHLVGASGLHDFATLLGTGYYQLYFVVVLFEFYVVFPPLLAFLRRARRWQVPALVLAAIWQVAFDEVLRHHLLPFSIGGKLESRLIVTYPAYLLSGMVVGLNYRRVHAWLVRRARVVLVGALVLAVGAVALNESANHVVVQYLAPGSDVLAPYALLYNAGAILALYVACVLLVRRYPVTRPALAAAGDATLGIYLAQMLWIPMLIRLAARYHWSSHLGWPSVCVIVVALVFGAGYLLTTLAERTPLARCLTGRRRVVPWHRRAATAPRT